MFIMTVLPTENINQSNLVPFVKQYIETLNLSHQQQYMFL